MSSTNVVTYRNTYSHLCLLVKLIIYMRSAERERENKLNGIDDAINSSTIQ